MTILKVGMSGGAVLNLQKNLARLGISPLSQDGEFGPQTLSAVMVFQAAHNLDSDGEVGPFTQQAITQALVGQIVPQTSGGSAPWMDWMRSHIGEIEQTGGKATEFDKEIFSHTSYGDLHGVMRPGCAATLCAALEETGYKSSHDARAESFRHVGLESQLVPGAILGMNWEGNSNHADHVTTLDHILDEKRVACLCGNQSHKLQISTFKRSAIIFIRWPLPASPKLLLSKPELETIEKKPAKKAKA